MALIRGGCLYVGGREVARDAITENVEALARGGKEWEVGMGQGMLVRETL